MVSRRLPQLVGPQLPPIRWICTQLQRLEAHNAKTFSVQVLHEDFSCAIKGRILLHGRLYVCSTCVCFYSNIFGHETKKVLPFRLIAELRRTRSALVNPAIEVSVRTAKLSRSYLFTSFFPGNRDACFNLCARLIRQHRAAHPVPMESPAPPQQSGASSTPAPVLASPAAASRDSLPAQNSRAAAAAADSSSTTAPSSTVIHDDDAPDGGDAHMSSSAEDAAPSFPAPPKDLQGAFDSELTSVLDTTLPIPVREFYPEFLAEDARYPLGEFYRAIGYTEVEVGEWTPLEGAAGDGAAATATDDGSTMSRSMKYRMPLPPNPMTPKSTRVEKGVKLERYWDASPEAGGGGEVLLLHGSARSFDVPFGDYFTTDERWLVTPAAKEGGDGTVGGATRVQVGFTVNFQKSTVFKSAIVSNAKTGVADMYAKWREAVLEHLQTRTAPAEVMQRMQDAQEAESAAAAQAQEREAALRKLPALPEGVLRNVGGAGGAAKGDLKYSIVLDRELPLPVAEFEGEFLGPSARFSFDAFQRTLGHTDVQIAQWAPGGSSEDSMHVLPRPAVATHGGVHSVANRDISFTMPLPRSTFAPDKTRVRKHSELHQCWVTDRHAVCGPPKPAAGANGKAIPPDTVPPGLTLVLHEASQSLDVPFADFFVTRTQWLVCSAPSTNSCRVLAAVCVHFSKSTMLQSTIEGKTKEGAAEFFDQWFTAALQHLMARRQAQAEAATAEAERAAAPSGSTPDAVLSERPSDVDHTALALALRELTLPTPATLAQPGHTPGDILKSYAKLYVLYQRMRQRLLADARAGAYKVDKEADPSSSDGSTAAGEVGGGASSSDDGSTWVCALLPTLSCGVLGSSSSQVMVPLTGRTRLFLAGLCTLCVWALLAWAFVWGLGGAGFGPYAHSYPDTLARPAEPAGASFVGAAAHTAPAASLDVHLQAQGEEAAGAAAQVLPQGLSALIQQEVQAALAAAAAQHDSGA